MYDIVRSRPYDHEVIYPRQSFVTSSSPPSAEAVLASVRPDLASKTLREAMAWMVAQTAMQTGHARDNLACIEVKTKESFFGNSNTTTIRFKR